MNGDHPPFLAIVEFLEAAERGGVSVEIGVDLARQRKISLQKTPCIDSVESDEAEIGADSEPEWCERLVDKGERQVDDCDSQSEDTDSPQVDSQMWKTVHALNVSNTHIPTTTLLEEISECTRRLLTDNTMNTAASESTSPGCIEGTVN